MNPILLHDIHVVEDKWHSLSNPRADLSKVHQDVKDLGMYGSNWKHLRNPYFSWLPQRRIFCTHRADVHQAIRLFTYHSFTQKEVSRRTGINYSAIHDIHRAVQAHLLIYLPKQHYNN